jgi:hypothetical protein
MDLFINELSFSGQAPGMHHGMLLASGLLDLIVSFKKLPKSKQVFSHSTFYSSLVTQELTILECLRRLPQSDITGIAYRLIAQGPYIDRILESEVPKHLCLFNGNDVRGSGLAGAAHLNGCLASLPDTVSLSGPNISVEFSEDGNALRAANLSNFIDVEGLTNGLWLKYAPIPKHAAGGWGTLMDLTPNVAEQVLNRGFVGPNGRQVYCCHQGRLFEFQHDNVGTFHGYPVRGAEVPSRTLREMRDANAITEIEYQRFITDTR